MSADLLFEIGCEEIPAKMLAAALAALPGQVAAKLAGARLAHGVVKALGTPRRIAVIVQSLADRQPDLDELVVGPPVGVAFAPDGTLSKAGKKGLYAVAQKHVTGEATRALLPAILKELASGIAWPKSMKWGWSEQTFVRPVQWLVALYGGEVVPFEWAGQTAGRQTRGHRFLSSGVHDLSNAGAYIPVLRSAHVLVDPDERAQRVREELARLARENNLVMRPDEALVAEVIHLGEWPVGVAGEFDPAFLEVPEEMIVTSMRLHQRYFAFEDAQGGLQNHFATLAATHVKDFRVVASGNEKVLASRLKDAQFFFAEDKKHSLDAWNKTLDSVVFQAKLPDGAKTIGDKVRRIEAIVAQQAGPDAARTAAKYCKADLASKAVGEFPELQGTMGKHYARFHRLGDAVAAAIEQHWWPKGQGAELPVSDEAALVAIADKMDTIAGCFAVGLEPTGSADPFGLRRAAIGILQIVLARGWDERFSQMLNATRAELAKHGAKAKEPAKLDDYFRHRLQGIFVEAGIPVQDASAALAQGSTMPADARARAIACSKISKEAREVFKRVANILDDARDYAAVFESLERLRPTVAAFFDKGGVMVMDPEPKLRDNRLALLNWFIAPYLAIADFRLLGGAQ